MPDRWPRFMVAWTLRDGETPSPDERDAERAALAELRASGHVLDGWIATGGRSGGFVLRDEDEAAARNRLAALPLAGRIDVTMHEIDYGAGRGASRA